LYIDTHAHLTYDDLRTQLPDVIDRAHEAGVEAIICVGTDLASSRTSIEISEEFSSVFASVGVHPHDAKEAPDDYLDQLRELASHSKVVSIGEMGLDFYRNLSPKEIQRDVFKRQLYLAAELAMPAIVHNRDADEAVLEVLTAVRHSRFVVHCFSSDVEMARSVLDLGGIISFTGIVTFGKNTTKDVLRSVPLEAVMLETDCPFLAPVPNRGKLNEPANVSHIALKIAEIRGETLDLVAEGTTSTARSFFGLPR
jgi:TatD DNase family protein|tara:strand:+ start:658 stop:1419 length:762 start_codon:yes stop_codon:yes gene_type:complete